MKKQIALFLAAFTIFTSSFASKGKYDDSGFEECGMWEQESSEVDLIMILHLLQQGGTLRDLPLMLPGFKLMNSHFDINKLGKEEVLPIFLVMNFDIDVQQKKDAISALIQHGADVNKKGVGEMTALMCAVMNIVMIKKENSNKKEEDKELIKIDNNIQMIEFLLEKGADPEKKSCNDLSPLFYSILAGHNDILKLFLSKKPELCSNAFPFALGARTYEAALLMEELGFDIDPVLSVCQDDRILKNIYSQYQAYKEAKKSNPRK